MSMIRNTSMTPIVAQDVDHARAAAELGRAVKAAAPEATPTKAALVVADTVGDVAPQTVSLSKPAIIPEGVAQGSGIAASFLSQKVQELAGVLERAGFAPEDTTRLSEAVYAQALAAAEAKPELATTPEALSGLIDQAVLEVLTPDEQSRVDEMRDLMDELRGAESDILDALGSKTDTAESAIENVTSGLPDDGSSSSLTENQAELISDFVKNQADTIQDVIGNLKGDESSGRNTADASAAQREPERSGKRDKKGELGNDRRELRADRKEIAHDLKVLAKDDEKIKQAKAQLEKDKAALAAETDPAKQAELAKKVEKDEARLEAAIDQRKADAKELKRDRAELREDRRDLREDRRDLRQDRQETRADRREARHDREREHSSAPPQGAPKKRDGSSNKPVMEDN